MKKIKLVRVKIIRGLLVIVVFASGPLLFLYADSRITYLTENRTFDNINHVPKIATGLLLGTAKLNLDGSINQYFTNRIAAATKLIRTAKINRLIISGDYNGKEYNEPQDMKNALIENGINPNVIHLDKKGFNTIASLKRAKEVFCQKEILIISQKFQNERAIYIADKINVKAFGFNAVDVDKDYSMKTRIREKGSRMKLFVYSILGIY